MAQFTVLQGGKNEISQQEDNFLKCYKTELISIEHLTFEELFSGFNTIKAITFSYDLGFVDKIMNFFDYGEIILGASFLVRKSTDTQEFIAETLARSQQAGKIIKKHNRLKTMALNNELEFKTTSLALDHRKLYLLKSDDGKTRVIKTSANMSNSAWNGNHIENYEYDDTPECYDEYIKDFETAWELGNSIVTDVIVTDKKTDDDLVESNSILQKAKKVDKILVVQEVEDKESIDIIKYKIDLESMQEKYKDLLKGTNLKPKNGIIELIPKTIEKINHNQKKLFAKKVEINNKTELYPSLTIDLDEQKCYLNNEIINTSPSKDEIKQNIKQIMDIFNNFNQFVAKDTYKLQLSHYKLMNAIFCSPFNAHLRCDCKIKNIITSSLPLFSLIASENANGGKTFMVKAALKMMTGKELDGVKACSYKKDDVRNTQLAVKGVPFFIDEIDNRYLSTIEDIIKDPEKCENNQIRTMPMLIFASNNVLKPKEYLRKRMVYIPIDAGLPSNIDKTAFESKGKTIIKKLDTSFYREYLKRMMNKVNKQLNDIIYTTNIPDDYYIDLMAISSETIVEIFKDYGYQLPQYIKKLTWNEDYSSDSNANDVILEIARFCKQNKKACNITKNTIIIECGDNDSKKKFESWKNILPVELNVSIQSTRDYYTITINRKEFENRLGYRIKSFSFFERK